MTKDQGVPATIVEVLPSNLYRIRLGDESEVLAHLSGKMLFNHIKVLLGDRVLVILDPYKGKTTNRITRRI